MMNAESPQIPVRPRRRIFFVLMFLVYVAILGEATARLYWHGVRKVPVTAPSKIWHTFYPELALSGVDQAAISNTDETYDVLILGDSVVSDHFGNISAQLSRGLEERLGRPVRCYNLAFAARTTRDSLIKYRLLDKQRFDLVVIYHGINDTRMNNCPPSLYRDDYRQCDWYHKIYCYQRSLTAPVLMLPYTTAFMAMSVGEGLGFYVPRHDPSPAWLDHGSDLKTPGAFRANLLEMIGMAKARGERVLLMSFAYHIPRDADGHCLPEKASDYAGGESMMPIWGRPDNIARGIDAHNAVIDAIHESHPELLFVDQRARMPRGPDHYFDCCHLTDEGCTIFVRNIFDALGETFAAR
jgi:hypothetical protein